MQEQSRKLEAFKVEAATKMCTHFLTLYRL